MGYHVDIEEESLRARMPEPAEIVQLKTRPGVPVIQVWQTFSAAGHAVETARTIYRADRHEFHYRLNIG